MGGVCQTSLWIARIGGGVSGTLLASGSDMQCPNFAGCRVLR